MLYNDEQQPAPRASRLFLPSGAASPTEFWLGGAHCSSGDLLEVEGLSGAWIIDCARDMPGAHMAAAGHAIYRVFIDIEDMPPNYSRIQSLAETVAACLQSHRPSTPRWEHPEEPPQRLYVMCTHGLNRSALVMGRILRAMGLSADDTVAVIRAARPGALANAFYERLIRD